MIKTDNCNSRKNNFIIKTIIIVIQTILYKKYIYLII